MVATESPDPMVAWLGPVNCVHAKYTNSPDCAFEALPLSITLLVGKATVVSLPALAIGGSKVDVTRIFIRSVPLAPVLSTTVNWNVYVPATSPETVGFAELKF